MEKAIKISQDLINFGKGNVEAFVKSGQIWTTGVQAIAKDFAETTQAQLTETAATVKSIATAKSLKEALELQTSLVRSSVEKAIAETTRLSGASTKLTTDTLAPLTARLTQARETFAVAV